MKRAYVLIGFLAVVAICFVGRDTKANTDVCKQGFVWREAGPADHVCVPPESRDRTAEENSLAESRRSPTGGAYGPDTCLEGFVWREAFDGDHVCVTPDVRDIVQEENSLALDRKALY